MNNPIISIILPAYNAESTIKDSIQSVIDQTYKNWELIIINDGSKDKTESVIQCFNDDRIIYIKNDSNRGLIFTLNLGIAKSKGKYIARMDADDISFPDRIQKQFLYMENHPETILCGTWCKTFGEGVKSQIKKMYETDKEIKDHFLFLIPVIHPTVLIRKSVLDTNKIIYDTNYRDAEDYKMWFDLMDFGSFYNLQEVLLNYRISKTQVSQNNNYIQIDSTRRIRRLYFSKKIGSNLYAEFEREGVTVRFIKIIKKEGKFLHELKALYFSINPLDFKVLLYYIIFDSMHYSLKDSVRFIKRFLGFRQSIL